MAVSIEAYDQPDESFDLYFVYFSDEDSIHTTVTRTPSAVTSWISVIERIHRRRLHRLVVGLDIEWRPNTSRYSDHPAATLQLCVGRRCLIFQLLHAPRIPSSLSRFLSNPSYTFVGVGISGDAEKLTADHGLRVSNRVDLRRLAADCLGSAELRRSGIKTLAWQVLGMEVDKPARVSRSRWDSEWLSLAQVQYACLDAFLSFEIGRVLNAAHSN